MTSAPSRDNAQRLRGLLLAALIPFAACLLMGMGSRVLAASLAAGTSITTATTWLVQLAAAGVAYRIGAVFVRLQAAPIFPRESYYGDARIAPEPVGRHLLERRWLARGVVMALAPSALAAALLFPTQPGPLIGLAAGLLIEARRARAALDPQAAIDLEARLRGRYLLYLRSFAESRASVALATLGAAEPLDVVLIVSPRRSESRSPFWYALGVLRPRYFDRLRWWSTVDAEWHRVVASCMDRSLGIVVDCAGLAPAAGGAPGLTLEAGMSLGFAGKNPTAYTLGPGQPPPLKIPTPALLRIGGGACWIVRHHRALVERLRAVAHRALPVDEQRYLDAYHANQMRLWQDAMVSDANLAAREGREDPRAWLLGPVEDRRSGDPSHGG